MRQQHASLRFPACVVPICYWCYNVSDLTAEQLHAQYTNWRAANEQYKGKTIAVRGRVTEVFHSWLTPDGWQSVALGHPDESVLCHFSPSAVDEISSLFEGELIVIAGVCEGEFAGVPILSNCEIVTFQDRWWIQACALCSLFVAGFSGLAFIVVHRLRKYKWGRKK
jgi:tRNA_anti-like